MKKFRRSVVFEIEAEDAEAADEAWGEDGPECASVGAVSVLDEGTIIEADRG